MSVEIIKSQLPGIFYRKPDPDSEPFKNAGDSVNEGDIVGIIEIMKQYTDVKSTVSGKITEFHVEDGASIDVDMPLLSVEPEK
ncbi:acetyl-CoA carboxylase [Castellaniella sp.]|uniref:acetyl-CoA carboxylase n=1 Tax=Castellaniella sp. TaxID=1955812 RepID=UPI003561F200